MSGPGPRVAIQPGFPSSQAKSSFNGGLETWLDCSPGGTGFHIPVSPHFKGGRLSSPFPPQTLTCYSSFSGVRGVAVAKFKHFTTLTCFIFSKSESSAPPVSLLLPAGFALRGDNRRKNGKQVSTSGMESSSSWPQHRREERAVDGETRRWTNTREGERIVAHLEL